MNCSEWADEDGDGDALTYRFETITRRQLNHGEKYVLSIHYDGSKFDVYHFCIIFFSLKNNSPQEDRWRPQTHTNVFIL